MVDDHAAVTGWETACAALAAAHLADPTPGEESTHVRRIEGWIRRLLDQPSPALVLAARCQHLERWMIPRGSFPMDRSGYHHWRLAIQHRQRERAREILLGAGCAVELAERVGVLVGKATVRSDEEGQALEDAACLVFLESEATAFAQNHGDYTPERLVGILRRTLAKMSPKARALAVALPLTGPVRNLVQIATSAPPGSGSAS